VSDQATRLMTATEGSLEAGIEQCVVGRRLSDISHAVQVVAEGAGLLGGEEYVATASGAPCTKSRRYRTTSPGKGPELKEGMVFAIEPMSMPERRPWRHSRTDGRS